nr:hypothetical protein [Candidatus Sigynarchaeota archaeon]
MSNETKQNLEVATPETSLELRPRTSLALRISFMVIAGIVAFYLFYAVLAFSLINLVILACFIILLMVLVFIVTSRQKKSEKDLPPDAKAKLAMLQQQEKVYKAEIVQLDDQINTMQKRLDKEKGFSENKINEKRAAVEQQHLAITKGPIDGLENLLEDLKGRRLNIQNQVKLIRIERVKLQNEKDQQQEDEQKLESIIKQRESEVLKKSAILQEDLQKKLTALEAQKKKKIEDLEAQKQQEILNLKNQLVQEEINKEILNKKRELEEKKYSLEEEKTQAQYQSLKDLIIEFQKTSDIVKKILASKEKFNDANIFSSFEKIAREIDACIHDLNKHGDNLENKELLVKSINLVNAHVWRLRHALSLQRSSPVLSVSLAPKDSIFFKINNVQFLCECCLRPVQEVGIKEPRRWIRWSLLGIKVLVDFAVSKGFAFFTSFIPSSIGDLNIPGPIKEGVDTMVSNVASSFGDLFNDFLKGKIAANDELFQDVLPVLQSIKNQASIENDAIPRAVQLTHIYFEKVVKSQGLDTIIKFLEDREKLIWQYFSHGEQEDIRKMLKETSNEELFTKKLILKNGLFVCENCFKWLEDIENKY